ncbi:hypothetical protein MKX01_004823 [Papaver californicum]|nr:hypothetical protein MKX01_004823 [Papaver californicum]
MVKMEIIRRKAPHQLFNCSTVFAVAICLFVSTEMASAWINKCNPGDLFIDSNNEVNPASCDNGYCNNWCRDLCSGMGTVATQVRCRTSSEITSCKCCCKEPPVYLPPDDSTDWGGLAPGDNNNCTSAQTFLKLSRTDGVTCKRQSICDAECSKIGLVTQRTECVANSNDVPGNVYDWYEQCCCGPPPPPPPCPCPDVNITISVKSGHASCCENTAKPPSSTCAAVLQ